MWWRQSDPLFIVVRVLYTTFDMVVCNAKLTNDFWWKGLQLWKCLYLARNVTKVNNVLSQSTLMDLPAISPVPPLTRETGKTTANKAALPLTACVPLTASDRCPALMFVPFTPCPTDLHVNLRSGHQVLWITYRLFWLGRLISCLVLMFNAKEVHLKFTFYADDTAAELNVSWGCVYICCVYWA